MAASVGQGRRRRRNSADQRSRAGHRYRGINLFVLGMSQLAFASNDPRWFSYRQAATRGWQVRKGEKATPVYFHKPIEIEEQTTDGGRETRRIPMLRTFSVFQASQIDGIPTLVPAVDLQARSPMSTRRRRPSYSSRARTIIRFRRHNRRSFMRRCAPRARRSN
jgi:antirestriction protein ArdC